MAKKRLPGPRNRLAALLLDHAYAFEAHRGLRALLDELLGMWGVRPRATPDGAIAKILPELVQTYNRCVALEAPFADVLGGCYMDLASRGQQQWLGQYFTPNTVCDLQAAMLIGELESSRLTRICDPACGAGAMLLAACRRVLALFGAEGLKRISVTGIDLDATCADMAAVQLLASCSVHDLPLGEVRVLRGDALDDPSRLMLVVHATARAAQPAVATAHHSTDKEETADAL